MCIQKSFIYIPWEEAFADVVLAEEVHQLKAGPGSASASPAHIGLS